MSTASDRPRSTVDPDARLARYGQWYDGYPVDIMIDAGSEIITQVNLLPANGDKTVAPSFAEETGRFVAEMEAIEL